MADDNDAFAKLDQEKIAQEVADKASEKALQTVKQAQDDLVSRLQGDKKKFSWEERGEKQPSNYNELFDEVKKQSPTLSEEDIDKRVEDKFKEKEVAQEKQAEEFRTKQAEQIEENRKVFDKEWYELVNENKLPKPSKEIQEKINKGEKLTREEIEADEGLTARLRLAQAATSSGKSAKLAFYEDYDKQPAGAKAPVLGGRPASPQNETEELDYEKDVKPQRKKIFGF